MANQSNQESVSVDLGSALVKIIVTDKQGAISQTVVANNHLGYSVPTKTTQIEPVGNLLKEIFNQHRLPKKNIRIAMPERLVSTQVISIPTLTDSELASSISWQAQQYIPIPKEDLALNYQVLFRPEKKDAAVQNMRVLLAGIDQNNLNNLTTAYKQAGLEPNVLETESIATLRNLKPDGVEASTMVVNFGASGLDLIIVKNNEIAMAISHQTGSDMITKALMNTFNLPADKAEEYKRAYGIDSRHAEGKIAQAIVPVAQTIITDIKNTLTFYNSKNNLQTIGRLVICGGGSLMPGFPELLAANLNLEIIPMDIFSDMTGNIPDKDHLLYPVAAGLAKRK